MSTTTAIRQRYPLVSNLRGLWPLTWMNFKFIILNPYNLGFSIALPTLMYLFFGASQEYGLYNLTHGNVSASVLISMTLLGVLLATASLGATVSLERVQGVSRLYAVTPLNPSIQILARLLANVGVATVIIIIVYLFGFFTTAKMSAIAWITSALIIVTMSLLSSALGLACGFAIRGDSSYAAVSAIIVLSAFASGMTIPLEQAGAFLQKIAPWTPLWGANQLSLLPLNGTANFELAMVISVVTWTTLFTIVAVWGLRRDTSR